MTETSYQIWSTPLGAAVTSLMETGAKNSTKIYAGGALIAEQREVNGQPGEVLWKSADPVTGSSIEIHKNGGLHFLDRTEREPLGQAVEPTMPLTGPGYPEPLKPRASDPQWLCGSLDQMLTEFHEQPAQCQQAVMASDHYELVWSEAKNTIKDQSAAHEAGRGGHDSPSHEVMQFSKKSTRKVQPEDETKGSEPKIGPGETKMDVHYEGPDTSNHDLVNASKSGEGKSSAGAALQTRDCNKEAGLSGANAVPAAAADIILTINKAVPDVSAEALAVTWRFEATFYNNGLFNPWPSPNKNQYWSRPKKGQKREWITPSFWGWDYGPFQINIRQAYKLADNKVAPYNVNDLDNPFGTLGGETFDGNIISNGILAAEMIKANGGDEAHQVSWYPGKINQKQRLSNYNQFVGAYRTFFNCWREKGGN